MPALKAEIGIGSFFKSSWRDFIVDKSLAFHTVSSLSVPALQVVLKCLQV